MIVPLRKQSDDKPTYFRPPPIEASLSVLYKLPIEEVARRASINDSDDSEYVPSECVLHFVRQSKSCGDKEPYLNLFTILRQRVLRAVPVKLQKVSGMTALAEKDSAAEIQEQVLYQFQKLLCLDRNDYDERLDFYEVRFASAIKALRVTAQRKVGKYESRRKPIESDGETLAPSLDMEQAIAELRQPGGVKEDDILYRSRLYDAISSLPLDQRKVIELLLQDFPIDSKDPEVPTIVRILGCAEKTVRNRRDRAFATLRDALKEEEVA